MRDRACVASDAQQMNELLPHCCAWEPNDRPSMAEVVRKVEDAIEEHCYHEEDFTDSRAKNAGSTVQAN